MIQRIQTVFLFFAALAMAVVFLLPLGRLVAEDGTVFTYLFYGFTEATGGGLQLKAIPLASLLLVIPLVSLVSIFLYGNRVLQLRLSTYNILLMAGSLVLIWFYGYHGKKEIGGELIYGIPVIMPIVAAILTYLAFRGIRKDELLVRSVERIR